MKKRILILLLAMLLGTTGALCTARAFGRRPIETVSWWSLLYERPNPERLPVRLELKWAKGLE